MCDYITSFTTAYNGDNATAEIAIMLLVAFALGYLLKHVLCSVRTGAEQAQQNPLERFAKDDLKIVEGIGPKIKELLQSTGINTIEQLSKTKTAELKNILRGAGERFAMHDPSTWADQAALAHEGKMEELQKFQDILIGGKTH